MSRPSQSHLRGLSGADQSRPRSRRVVARAANGQAQTYRLAPTNARHSAYRRVALAILHLDVATLASELLAARRSALPHAA